MDTLNAGTKEIVSVPITDRLNSISSLDGYNVEAKIVTEDESATKQDWTTILNTTDMRADVLIDTTNWDEGTYKLYLRINVPPELPILGPILLQVS